MYFSLPEKLNLLYVILTSTEVLNPNSKGDNLAIRKYLSLELGMPNCSGVNMNS